MIFTLEDQDLECVAYALRVAFLDAKAELHYCIEDLEHEGATCGRVEQFSKYVSRAESKLAQIEKTLRKFS